LTTPSYRLIPDGENRDTPDPTGAGSLSGRAGGDMGQPKLGLFRIDRQSASFLAAELHKLSELRVQLMNVMLRPPSAHESDEVFDVFLSNNPLLTKVELLRLLIDVTQSARSTFSQQKRKRSTAGKVGGRSTPKNIAAAKLKEWVDGHKPTANIRVGGVRAAARRLAQKAPSDFWNSLDDPERVIEMHLKTKLDKG